MWSKHILGKKIQQSLLWGRHRFVRTIKYIRQNKESYFGQRSAMILTMMHLCGILNTFVPQHLNGTHSSNKSCYVQIRETFTSSYVTYRLSLQFRFSVILTICRQVVAFCPSFIAAKLKHIAIADCCYVRTPHNSLLQPPYILRTL